MIREVNYYVYPILGSDVASIWTSGTRRAWIGAKRSSFFKSDYDSIPLIGNIILGLSVSVLLF
jgi:hypothetical protein